MKHLRLFNTNSEYVNAESEIVSPSVSWVVETDIVHYKSGESDPAEEMVTFEYADELSGYTKQTFQVVKGTTLEQFLIDIDADSSLGCADIFDVQGNPVTNGESEEWNQLVEEYGYYLAVPIQEGYYYQAFLC